MEQPSTFWSDLAEDLKDPEFVREYVAQSVRISTIDSIVNTLDAAREDANLSKAELARSINVEPATIRRLFSSTNSNPTLGTLAEVAAVLGLEIHLSPLAEAGKDVISTALRSGAIENTTALEQALKSDTSADDLALSR